jgi:hypothetical protein
MNLGDRRTILIAKESLDASDFFILESSARFKWKKFECCFAHGVIRSAVSIPVTPSCPLAKR